MRELLGQCSQEFWIVRGSFKSSAGPFLDGCVDLTPMLLDQFCLLARGDLTNWLAADQDVGEVLHEILKAFDGMLWCLCMEGTLPESENGRGDASDAREPEQDIAVACSHQVEFA